MAGTLQFDAVVSTAQLNKLLEDLRTGAEGAAKAINSALGGTVTKKLVLEEVVNSKGQKQLVAVEKERLSITDQLVSKQKQLNATQAGSVTSLRQQVNSLKQARDAAARYETSVSAVGGSIRRQRTEWSALNNQVSKISRELAVASASSFWDRIKVATRSQGLINISNGLVGLTQGFQAASILAGQFVGAINSVVDASAKLQSFALSFKAIGAGAAGGITGLQESSRIALGLGVDLNTVQEGFKQLSPVVLNIGGTLGSVGEVVEALSSRFAAFGISGDRARRVMNGVIQAFSKGKLQAEELTQQISEADPAFKTDLAAALGAARDSLGDLGKEIDGTVPGLEKLVKAGKITGEVLLKVLPLLGKSALLYGKLGSSAGSAVDALEKGSVTIDQVRSNLQTLNDLSLRELALSSEPLINALLRLQAVATDAFTRISQSDGIDALSSIGAKAVEVVAKLADGFFVLAEGAISIVGALKPVLDLALAIAEIPGVAQLAGVALLGKLLGPLKLLEGRVASTRAAFQGLKSGFGDVFSGPRNEINQLTNDIQKMNATLGQPTGQNRQQGAASRITTGTREAIKEITALGATSASEIQAQITRLEANIARAQAKLAKTLPARTGGTTAAGAKGQASQITEETGTTLREVTALGARSAEVIQGQINKLEAGIEGTRKRLADLPAPRPERVDTTAADAKIKSQKQLRLEVRQTEISLESMSRIMAKRRADIELGLPNIPTPESLALSYKKAQEKLEGLQKQLAAPGPGDNAVASGREIRRQERLRGLLDARIKKVKELRVELAQQASEQIPPRKPEQTSPSIGDGSGLTDTEIKRQERLRARLDANLDRLQELRTRLAEQGPSTIQDRRAALSFDPNSTEAARKATEDYTRSLRENAKERFKTSEFAGPSFSRIADEEKKALGRLQEIEKERADIAKRAEQTRRFNVAGFDQSDFGTDRLKALGDETDKLRGRLGQLRDERGKLLTESERYASLESNVSKVLKDGSKETATATQRQKALEAQREITKRQSQAISSQLEAETKRLKEATAARENLEKRRSGGKAVSDGSDTTAGLERRNREIERSKASIIALNAEQSKLQGQISKVDRALSVNAKSFGTFGSAAKNAGAALGGLGARLLSIGNSGLKGFGNGISSILGLLDPFLVLMIAAGVGSRLYADGMKKATEASKRFEDTNGVLSASIKDLVPEQEDTAKASTALARIWARLADAAVGIGDTFGAAFEGLAGFFENAVTNVQNFATQFTDALGSVGTTFGAIGDSVSVFTAGAIGALTGLAIAGPIGGTVLALAGVMAALALGTSDAEVAQKELAKEMVAVEAGSAATTVQVIKLAAAIATLRPDEKTGEVDLGDLTKAKEGVESLRRAQALQRNELDKTNAAYDLNQKSLKETGVEIDDIKAKLLEQERVRANIRETTSPFNEDANRQARESTAETDRLNASLATTKKRQEQLQISTGTLANSQQEQNNNLAITNARTEESAKVYEKLREANVKTAKSTISLGDAIKKLQENNETLELGDPEAQKTLDKNITQIKQLQELVERLGKTSAEIKIELQVTKDSIADANDIINLEPGAERDSNKLLRDSDRVLKEASERFQSDAKFYEERMKGSVELQKLGAQLTTEAGIKFLQTIQQSRAALIESARDLEKALRGAQSSLSNLTLSKPQFFSPAELRAAADEINRAFEKNVQESGVRPPIPQGTEIEQLQFKADFNDTREQADSLRETIGSIENAVIKIAERLGVFGKKELEDIKKKGGDLVGIVDQVAGGAKDAVDVTPRIGEVFGEITANGETTVLFFDNLTGQTKELSKAEFDAAVAADKLAASIKSTGKEAKDSEGKMGGLGTKIGQVFGEITSNGETQVLFFNKATGETESLSKAAFERLKLEDAVNKKINEQNTGLKSSLELASDINNARGRATPPTPPSVSEQIGAQGGRSFASGPGGMLSLLPENMDQVNKEWREIARRNGGDYNKVLSDVIVNGGPQFMSQGILGQISNDLSRYRNATEMVKLAQEQATDFQNRYNQALASGSPELITLAAGLEMSNAALAQTKDELDIATGSYRDAASEANRLGIAIDSVPLIGETWTGEPVKTAQERWNDYVDSVRQGSQQINQSSQEINQSLQGIQGVDNKLLSPAEVDASNQALNTYGQNFANVINGINNNKPEDPFSDIATQGSFSLDVLGEKATSIINGIDALTIDDPFAQASQAQSVDAYAQNFTTLINTINGIVIDDPFAQAPLDGVEEYATQASATLEELADISIDDPLVDTASSLDALSEGVTTSNSIATSLGTGATNAQALASAITSIPSEITVNVKTVGIRGYAAGGPVSAGQEVQVNEQGKEGFLSRGGKLSQINVPAYATWRPPSSGTIIPAPVWGNMKDPASKGSQGKALNVYNQGAAYVVNNISSPVADEPSSKPLQWTFLDAYTKRAVDTIGGIKDLKIGDPFSGSPQNKPLDAYAQKATDIIDGISGLRAGNPFAEIAQGQPLDAYAQKANTTASNINDLDVGDPFAKVAQSPALETYTDKAAGSIAAINDLDVDDPFAKVSKGKAWDDYSQKAVAAIRNTKDLQIKDPLAAASEGKTLDAYTKEAVSLIGSINDLAIDDPFAEAAQGNSFNAYAKKATDYIETVDSLVIGDPFATASQGQALDAYAKKAFDTISGISDLVAGDPFAGIAQGQSFDSYGQKAVDTVNSINNLQISDPFKEASQGQSFDAYQKKATNVIESVNNLRISDPFEEASQGQSFDAYSSKAVDVISDVDSLQADDPFAEVSKGKSLGAYTQKAIDAADAVNDLQVDDPFTKVATGQPFDSYISKAVAAIDDISKLAVDDPFSRISQGESLDSYSQKATDTVDSINNLTAVDPFIEASKGQSLDAYSKKAIDVIDGISSLQVADPFREVAQGQSLDSYTQKAANSIDAIGDIKPGDPFTEAAQAKSLQGYVQQAAAAVDAAGALAVDDPFLQVLQGDSLESYSRKAAKTISSISDLKVQDPFVQGSQGESLNIYSQKAAGVADGINDLAVGDPFDKASEGQSLDAYGQKAADTVDRLNDLQAGDPFAGASQKQSFDLYIKRAADAIDSTKGLQASDPFIEASQGQSFDAYTQKAADSVKTIDELTAGDPFLTASQGQSLDDYTQKATDTINGISGLDISDPFTRTAQGLPLDAYAKKAADTIDGIDNLKVRGPSSEAVQGQPFEGYAKQVTSAIDDVNSLRAADPFSAISQERNLDAYAQNAIDSISELQVRDPFAEAVQGPSLGDYTKKAADAIDSINGLTVGDPLAEGLRTQPLDAYTQNAIDSIEAISTFAVNDPFAEALGGQSFDAYRQEATTAIGAIDALSIADPFAKASQGQALDAYKQKAVDTIDAISDLAVGDPFAKAAEGQSFDKYSKQAIDSIQAVNALAVDDPFAQNSQGQFFDDYAKKAADTISSINTLQVADFFAEAAQGRPLDSYVQKATDSVESINRIDVVDPLAGVAQGKSLDAYGEKVADVVDSVGGLQVGDPFGKASEGRSFDIYSQKAVDAISGISDLRASDPFSEVAQAQPLDTYFQKAANSIEGIGKLAVDDPLADITQGQPWDAYAQKAVSAIDGINGLGVDDPFSGSLAGIKAIADNVQLLQGLTIDDSVAAAGKKAPRETQEEVVVTRQIRNQDIALGEPLEFAEPTAILVDRPSPEGIQDLRQAAQRSGEEYNRLLAAAVASEIDVPSFSIAPGPAQADSSGYEESLRSLQGQVLAANTSDLTGLVSSLGLMGKALVAAGAKALGIAPSYRQAASAARELGTAVVSIPSLDAGVDNTPLLAAADSWKQYAGSMLQSSRVIAGAAQEDTKEPMSKGAIDSASQAYMDYASLARKSIKDVNKFSLDGPLADGATPVDRISKGLDTAADNAAKIKSSIDKLKDMTVNISVTGVPGFFTGGPVSAGQEIRVNELGKEGFLSRGGNLSPINVPANATWRPPTSGTVIPAHVWKQIDAPNGRVKVSDARAGDMASRVGSGRGSELSALARRIELSMLRDNASGGTGELAAVQAMQATEIGKLSRAVDKLADKKWNVQVNTPSNSSGDFLSAINHRM